MENHFEIGDRVAYVGDLRALRGELGTVTRIHALYTTIFYGVKFDTGRSIMTSCHQLKRPLSDMIIRLVKEEKPNG